MVQVVLLPLSKTTTLVAAAIFECNTACFAFAPVCLSGLSTTSSKWGSGGETKDEIWRSSESECAGFFNTGYQVKSSKPHKVVKLISTVQVQCILQINKLVM